MCGGGVLVWDHVTIHKSKPGENTHQVDGLKPFLFL